MIADIIYIIILLYSGKEVNRQMRETSNPISTQQLKQFRGGEKKVMKKSLSLLVAIAMVFSMFASMASAAELTTQQKFDALKEAGIFTGYPDGSAGLENDMTRAEFAKVLALLNGLDLNNAKATYSDVSANHWARAHIGAVSDAGLMNGIGGGKFGPTIVVTVEQLAKTIVLSSGLQQSNAEVKGTVSNWAKGYVAAAIEAGFIPELSDYTANATRGQLVDASYEVFVQKHQPTIKASQTGAKTITVEFSKALTDDQKKDLTFEVKNGNNTIAVTVKYAEDNKSVALTASYLPEGNLTVNVKGFDPLTVKTEKERAASIEIGAPTLQKADNQDLRVKTLNQFGEEIKFATVTVTAFNATKGISIPVSAGKVNLASDDVAKVDDTIVVTATNVNGLYASKQYKVVTASSATKIEIGEVQPLKDKTRITVGDKGLVLPIKLTDQYGQEIKLNATTAPKKVVNNFFALDGITFYAGGTGAVDNFSVDKDGKVTFEATQAGTVTITATNAAVANAYASVTVNIVNPAEVKELKLSNPNSFVVSGEEVVVPFEAVDSFGAVIDPKEVSLDKVRFLSAVEFAAGYPKINGKGELLFKFAGHGMTNVLVVVNGFTTSQLQLDVLKASEFQALNGVKDVLTTLVEGASVEFDKDNITYVDQYGRTKNVTDGTYTIETADASIAKVENGRLVAGKEGSTTLTIKYTAVQNATPLEVGVTVVKASDVKTYEIKSVGTIYGNKDQGFDSKYAKTVELVGKIGDTQVALVKSTPDFVTSSVPGVVAVDSYASKIVGKAAGTSTIAAYVGSNKVAEASVTVSDAAPVATTAKFKEAEYKVAKGSTITVEVEVKDQYGVDYATAGALLSGDTAVATTSGLTVTGVKKGSTTLTYVTSNNVTATASLEVTE